MARRDRYDVTALPEAQTEPGSKGRVLRNLLGIRRVRDINLVESQALNLAQTEATKTFSDDHRFTAKDVCHLHKLWLGPIYEWAGEYRSVNISKGGFPFATASLIPSLMHEFERSVLARHTPCRPAPDSRVAESLAAVHGELILIHPFREGNGRLARLLAVLMGLQAGLPPLDFSSMLGRGKRIYIAAIHAALAKDYEPLTGVFEKIIDQTWRSFASNDR